LGNQKENEARAMKFEILPVKDIRPSPFQPRQRFEEESLKELANSMRNVDILQPIVVRRHQKGYEIIAGERRWRAARIAGLKEIPCIVRDSPEEKVLLESLVENLHRLDLTDVERENAIHALWEKRKDLGFSSKAEMARALGVSERKIQENIEAWEFRHREAPHGDLSTRAIRATDGLETEERKKALEKVSRGEFKVSELDTVAKVIKKAPRSLKHELLKPKSFVTPRMAEAIVEKLPKEEDQNAILQEVRRHRLTEDEVEDRIREIRHAEEAGRPARKEMGVKEGTTYTVGEYECAHCKRHYLIKCNGKQDWLE